MENIIEIEHLNKSFGEVKAVQDLSFQVKEGEIVYEEISNIRN